MRADAQPDESASSEQRRDKSATSGLAIGAGFGNDTAGLGGVFDYYVQGHNPRLRIALSGALGAWPALGWGTLWRPAVALGVRGSFGRRQRMTFGLHAVPHGAQVLALHGEEMTDAHVSYGVGLQVGWEWMKRGGFFMRASIGPGYGFYPRIYREVGYWTASFNVLTMGYKLW
ncbi:MAG: hypothetical protein QM778_26590 [Myxococcales bacterium]